MSMPSYDDDDDYNDKIARSCELEKLVLISKRKLLELKVAGRRSQSAASQII